MRLISLSLIFSLIATHAFAQGSTLESVKAAISAAERVCLVGDRYRFQAEADGGLTISKLLPGVTGKVVVDRTRASGGQFFNDEAVRRLVDDDTRKCMSSEWPRVLNALQKQSESERGLFNKLAGSWCLAQTPQVRVTYLVISGNAGVARITRTVTGDNGYSVLTSTGDWQIVNGGIFGPAVWSDDKPIMHVLHLNSINLMDEFIDLYNTTTSLKARLEVHLNPQASSPAKEVEALEDALPRIRTAAIRSYLNDNHRTLNTKNFRRCG